MINSAIISGNLVRDAEQVVTKSGNPLAKFTVAINRYIPTDTPGQYDQETSYIDCVMYGQRSEKVAPYLTKGAKVVVSGNIAQDRWEKDGEKRSKVYVKVFSVELMTQRDQSAPATPEPIQTPDTDNIPF